MYVTEGATGPTESPIDLIFAPDVLESYRTSTSGPNFLIAGGRFSTFSHTPLIKFLKKSQKTGYKGPPCCQLFEKNIFV